ncbi:MAG: DegV family protein [Ruthenibacterium sp.]
MDIQIIADTSCDLTPALANVLRVSLVSFKLSIGADTFIDDASLDVKQLIATMKAYKGAAATACPSPDDFATYMRKAKESVVVTISSHLSGCYNSAMVARDMVLEEDPTHKIHVFDSESASAGETRVALLLRDMIDADLPFEEIVTRGTAFIATMRTRFVLEDLGNLIKNGRISKAAGLLGTMLNLRPIMSEDGHGEIICLEKVRGTQNSMRRLVEIVAETTQTLAKGSTTMVLSYCNCVERATELKKDILAKCTAFDKIIMVPTAGLSTVYANDGGVILAY